MRWNILLLSICCVATSFAAEPCQRPEEPVDQISEQTVDVTGDARPDLIRLHITGSSCLTPFRWSLRILKDGTEIYRYESDDSWLDKFFSDEGYVGGCSSYLDCKRSYYFKGILSRLVQPAPNDPESVMWDPSNNGSIFVVAKAFLAEKHQIAEREAEAIVAELAQRLRSGQLPAILVPKSPVQNNFPLAYCAEVKQFVPVYEW
ncbi:MAG: hypothetical protein ACE5HC_16170 [Candidatus Binatia bacterium]